MNDSDKIFSEIVDVLMKHCPQMFSKGETASHDFTVDMLSAIRSTYVTLSAFAASDDASRLRLLQEAEKRSAAQVAEIGLFLRALGQAHNGVLQ